MNYELVNIEKLIPLEKVFPHHLENIKKMIEEDKVMRKAIIADSETGTILDGSHRYAFLLEEGYRLAPVHWVNYSDENIRVGSKLSHRFLIQEESQINKKECINRSTKGELFSPRTTRHFFPFRKTDIAAHLYELKPGKKRNINYLIESVEYIEEILHNKRYLQEIDEEMHTLSDYIAEMVESRRYLTAQIEMLNSALPVAFFPGKFHPPHMGHVQTILKLAPHFRKLIVGVTSDTPEDKVITQAEAVNLLKNVLVAVSNVEVISIEGTLVKKADTSDLPKFDLLLTGNPTVMEWAKKMQVNSKYVERAFGLNCSGEKIRATLNQQLLID